MPHHDREQEDPPHTVVARGGAVNRVVTHPKGRLADVGDAGLAGSSARPTVVLPISSSFFWRLGIERSQRQAREDPNPVLEF